MTDSTTVTVKIECKKCGGQRLILPDDPTDDGIVKCEKCGNELGRWGDIKATAHQRIRDEVAGQFRSMLKESFKGLKFIKVE